MKDKKTIKKVLKALDQYNKMDKFLFNILNDRYYEKYGSPVFMAIQDLSLIAISGKSWDELHENYTTPGMNDTSKPIAWDEGFIPEKIENCLQSDKDIDKRVDKINTYLCKLEEIDREWNEKK